MMSLKLRLKIGVSVMIFVAAAGVSAQSRRVSNFATAPYSPSTAAASTISTLYSQDPLAGVLCFADGREGYVMHDGQVFNRCSHIDFDRYKAGSLNVGLEGADVGAIVDLGTPDDLNKEYGYGETVGKGQGFASIAMKDGKMIILKDRKSGMMQALTEASQLSTPSRGMASAEAKVGHIYLVRISNPRDENFQVLVKLLVLEVRLGESVTFRWELL